MTKLSDLLYDLLAAFNRTLETLDKIAPVDQLTEAMARLKGPGGRVIFWPHDPRRQWLEDSPLRNTWRWCLEAETIAKSILEHYVNLDVPAMENGSTFREMND